MISNREVAYETLSRELAEYEMVAAKDQHVLRRCEAEVSHYESVAASIGTCSRCALAICKHAHNEGLVRDDPVLQSELRIVSQTLCQPQGELRGRVHLSAPCVCAEC